MYEICNFNKKSDKFDKSSVNLVQVSLHVVNKSRSSIHTSSHGS